MEDEKNLLSPKLDVVFHALFREDNKGLLSRLISDVIQEEVKVVTTDKNRYVDIKEADEKLGIMDLRAELEGGKQCNIEIQLEEHQGENERILYYWADTYTRQIKRGEEYKKLEKTISIVILNHEIEELKGIEKMGVKWQIRDNETGKRVLTDRLEIVIIEIPKAKRIYKENKQDKIGQWMIFLDNPNDREVEDIMSKNKNIKKALDELEQVSGDEKIRRIAELREKAIRDEKAARAYAIEKGLQEGLQEGLQQGLQQGLQEGLQQGLQQGREEGLKKGKEQGKKERDIEIAKKMIKEGVDKEFISKITELTIEEIDNIDKN